MNSLDVLIIGAGVVGSAIAREVNALGMSCWLVDRNQRMGGETTHRNSGVVHAGIYYPSESLKTKLCIQGRKLLYQWVKDTGVRYKNCGKIIVATEAAQLTKLEHRLEHAKLCGVDDLSFLSERALLERTGIQKAVGALLSPSSGIVDPIELTRSFVAHSPEVELLLNTEVTAIHQESNGYRVETNRGEVHTKVLINSAGLYSAKIAELGGMNHYKLFYCRGDYFTWRTNRVIDTLIYPVKDPLDPGLGIHLTIDLNGGLKWGPDAEYVGDSIDYGPADHKHEQFLDAVRRLYPEVQASNLYYEGCGIRPKLRSPDSSEEWDFVISEDQPGFINLVGIESPGLTASMAIAKHVTEMLAT